MADELYELMYAETRADKFILEVKSVMFPTDQKAVGKTDQRTFCGITIRAVPKYVAPSNGRSLDNLHRLMLDSLHETHSGPSFNQSTREP